MDNNKLLAEQNKVHEKIESETIREDINTEKYAEVSEKEKRELFIKALKDLKMTYKPKKHFGVAYKKERKRKNKQVKASRRANRK